MDAHSASGEDGVLVGVRGGAAAEEHERLGTRVVQLVHRARCNHHAVARAHGRLVAVKPFTLKVVRTVRKGRRVVLVLRASGPGVLTARTVTRAKGPVVRRQVKRAGLVRVELKLPSRARVALRLQLTRAQGARVQLHRSA